MAGPEGDEAGVSYDKPIKDRYIGLGGLESCLLAAEGRETAGGAQRLIALIVEQDRGRYCCGSRGVPPTVLVVLTVETDYSSRRDGHILSWDEVATHYRLGSAERTKTLHDLVGIGRGSRPTCLHLTVELKHLVAHAFCRDPSRYFSFVSAGQAKLHPLYSFNGAGRCPFLVIAHLMGTPMQRESLGVGFQKKLCGNLTKVAGGGYRHVPRMIDRPNMEDSTLRRPYPSKLPASQQIGRDIAVSNENLRRHRK
ncbi:hypothetical protein An01g05520 [Aspergillus niger]|uniref:Uncharacterized protein n=2 Tax=Aspergillus niger TaxID=5061 RepID=A2Q8T7_ASPNC|nr:hypothetical protein An01g05520 [Aspergillus niger]CAK43720.1 hypothetical protein An01g05520 [Aspergillus niger]